MNIKIKLLLTAWLIITISLAYYVIVSKHKLLKYKGVFTAEVDTNGSLVLNNSQLDYIRMLSEVQNSYYENKSIIIEHIADKTPLLIYRYTKDMCYSCIIEDLEELANFQKELEGKHIFIFPTYEENRYDNIILSNDLHNFEYKNIPINLMKVPTDINLIIRRYFGYIDSQGNLSMIYFPIKGKKDQTQSYFYEIKRKMQQEL